MGVAWTALFAAPLGAEETTTEPPKIATVVTIVAPDFPAVETTGPVEFRVAVRGIVTAAGAFQVSEVVAPEVPQAFVVAVTERLRWWRFQPATDETTCTAAARPFAFSVWFEGTRADPHVYLSVPKAESPSTKKRSFASITVPPVRFPRDLLEFEGRVDALMAVDAAGNVVSSHVLSSTPFGVFDTVVLKAAAQAHVVWNDGEGPAPGATRCLVQAYTFCVSGGLPRFEYSGCPR